jgi:hypothetical protein
MNNKLTITYFLIGAGLLVYTAFTTPTLPSFIGIVYALPIEDKLILGFRYILPPIMLAVLLYSLDSWMQRT